MMSDLRQVSDPGLLGTRVLYHRACQEISLRDYV